MNLQFDSRGNLKQQSPIQIEIEVFEEEFVFNEERKLLFDNYVKYNNYLKEILGKVDFYQWIDGSYVTKKTIPKDIDIVNFVDFEVYENIVSKHKKLEKGFIKDKFNLDTYFVAIYPQNHKKYFYFQSDSAYWNDWFSKTNPKHDSRRKKYPKSFIQINHK
jgi:hypothetical protein